ncbi:MAG: YciI family protein [Clostridiaceae bacterium]
MREYIYFLKLIPRLHDEKNWTKNDDEIINQHFLRLKKSCEDGIVFTAGKTEDDKGFGIVIFSAENEVKATLFMMEDPAVKFGIMTAEVFPYRTALGR